MFRRNFPILAVLAACAVTVIGVALAGDPSTQARVPSDLAGAAAPKGPQGPLPNRLKDMPEDMKINHGKYDNLYTALYEQWLAGGTVPDVKPAVKDVFGQSIREHFSPNYGVDVRMSSAAFAGTQNEFQIDINPTNSQFAIGSSNDGRTAGVGIYRTSDSGATWIAQDAPVGTGACCDPAVAYAFDGTVYVGVLDTSPAGQLTIRSTDNGATWSTPSFVALPDRNNIVVDNGPTSPRRGNLYVTYSDLGGGGTNRIKGYRSTDGGVTWGTSFLVGGPAPAAGYQQSSQPRVASDGTLYVGYQQYLNSGTGCSAGVQNAVAKSTDGGATFTQTVFDIQQGGACLSTQAGRGVFCVNAAGGNFRSRSHPILAIHPTNPQIVYVVYSGGELDSTYTCGGGTGRHGDTLFRKSTDGGATFSEPTKINTDPQGNDQYYPWVDVAPNGTIWAGWNDRSEDPNNYQTRWYQAYSTNEGTSWSVSPVADALITPPSSTQAFYGDYMGLAAENDLVLGMWFDNRSTASGDPYTDPHVPVTGPTSTPCVSCTNTPTRTITNTPAATNTRTVTATPTCGPGYNYTTGTATIVPGTTDTGNHGDDVSTNIALPFPFSLYGVAYNSANVISNGNLQFATTSTAFTNTCLPAATHGAAILPFWEDLRTDTTGTCTGGCGIYTSISGTAPNRIFNIEWRTYYFTGTGNAYFEIRLYEGTNAFDIVIGTLTTADSATTGVQNGTLFTQYQCLTTIADGLLLNFTLGTCGPTNTPGPSNTPTSSNTPVPTNTFTTSPTNTLPAATSTSTVTNTPNAPTATPCVITFTDVLPTDYFYVAVEYLACRGVISGYTDNTFRPFNTATRGQMAKIIVLAESWTVVCPATATFTDVPTTHPFFCYVETAFSRGIISGYSDGTFRPGNNVTRGQTAKIVVSAEGWTDPCPTTATFTDVPTTHPFFCFIETAFLHGIISGYSDGTFRPGNDVTRGQLSKIVHSAVTAP